MEGRSVTIHIWLISDDREEDDRLDHLADLVRDGLDEHGMIYAQGEIRNKEDSGRHIYITDIQ